MYTGTYDFLYLFLLSFSCPLRSFLPSRVLIFLNACLPALVPACLLACLPACFDPCPPACQPIYLPACLTARIAAG